MKKTLIQKRLARAAVETLETRCLLSATVDSQIPPQTVTVGQPSPQVTLNQYLGDPQLTGGTVVAMETPLGNMFFQLTNSQTPNTVANFVTYINNGQYVPTIIQRSVPGFVLQGGGTKPDGSNNAPVQTLNGEPGISNTAGTIAMALSDGPNTGTNQWFINLADNSSSLDNSTPDMGPFTVFGNVIDGGMTVANNIANLSIINASSINGNWSTLPVINYTSGATLEESNLVTDNIVQVSSPAVAFSAVSSNPSVLKAKIRNGVLILNPGPDVAAGEVSVQATVTDLAGETATSTFNVDVVIPPLANLDFVQGPSNVKAGHVMTPPITVSVTDSSSDPSSGVAVKLAIVSGPAGAVLNGTTKVTAENGVATFSNISLNVAGTYTLEAVHGALTSSPSTTFTVKHTAATQIAFAATPTTTTVGSDIDPPVTVNVEDQFGNIVANNASAVTLSIKPGTGPDGAILGGTLTEFAVDGVARFSDITLSEAAVYKLKAVDGNLPSAKTKAFDVIAAS